MHLLVRESRSLDDDDAAVDLGHGPAELVLLSFSDADLGAAAAAWAAMGPNRPGLRLVNISLLRHPMSVDLYVERVIARARCIIVRLLGGLDYWRYGAEEAAAACRHAGIPIILVPGDARPDARLTDLSTASAHDVAAVDAYMAHGGPENFGNALRLAARLIGVDSAPIAPPAILPSAAELALPVPQLGPHGTAALVFYRSHYLSGDIAPIQAIAEALAARGLGVRALHCTSLKDPAAAAEIASRLAMWRPRVVLNATGFAARQEAGSPLDAADAPVLQLVLTVGSRDGWAASPRGLSPTDLAMQVVLPELDGRLLTTAVSFKVEAEEQPGLSFRRVVHRPEPEGVALAADRAVAWARLAATPRPERRIGIILSDYPGADGGGQLGHAVGLDSLASLDAITVDLQDAGYEVAHTDSIGRSLAYAAPTPTLNLTDYHRLMHLLPETARSGICETWGPPEADPAFRDGVLRLPHRQVGNLTAAVQPDRGACRDRKSGYHDPDTPPRHAYVAFYLWLREVIGVHALVHLGTHGTLEWLPGKSVALSSACYPAALTRGLPVIYPFIVNNPGEASAAKRRLGAVTIGHLTPPLRAAGSHGRAVELERLIDEFAAADGMDRRRTSMLRREILDRAAATGLLAESGVTPGAPDDEALARLDAYLCDVKDLLIREGLHVFGRAPSVARRALLLDSVGRLATDAAPEAVARTLDASPEAERTALLAALDGRFIHPGPAGAPTRGRLDVLPTGRNLYTVDPRAIPTRSAMILGERAAAELLRRHLQDHGEYPRTLVIDLWGSATMRTGGEDLALALVLVGARPVWDDGSSRVSGVEILPLAVLDRPRVDVTLRISGLFRDAFPSQIALFDAAVRAVAVRDEAPDFNPLAATARGLDESALRRATSRVFGTPPGSYGLAVSSVLSSGEWQAREDIGAAYLASSAFAYGHGLEGTADSEGFAARVAAADAFVHAQDHAEMDLLEGIEHAVHEGGFAAAAGRLGTSPALYHLDTSQPLTPRGRTVAEEVSRVVRGRAANPHWIAGMMSHGYRGAAEMARAVEGLHAYASTLPTRFDSQFDLLFEATLGDADVDQFLRRENPAARLAIAERFRDALRRDLWRSRRNSVRACLAETGR